MTVKVRDLTTEINKIHLSVSSVSSYKNEYAWKDFRVISHNLDKVTTYMHTKYWPELKSFHDILVDHIMNPALYEAG